MFRLFRGEVLTPGLDLHPEGGPDARDLAPYSPESENAQYLSVRFAPHGGLPASGAYRVGLTDDVAGAGDDQRHRSVPPSRSLAVITVDYWVTIVM